MSADIPLTGQPLEGAAVSASIALLSLIATGAFLIWTATLYILSHSKASCREWAKSRITFLSTPFGVLFVNLMVADAIVASAWTTGFVWVGRGSYNEHTGTCVAQALFIQIGDLCSALTNLLIAVHTFCVLSPKVVIPRWRFKLILPALWSTLILMAVIPPSVKDAWSGERPYYAWTGVWCWVSSEYMMERLLLHYLWIFLAEGGSLLLYIILFWRLRQRFRLTNHVTESQSSALKGVKTPSNRHLAAKAKLINRAGRFMLLYPAAFILVTLPLASYRIAAFAGHDWGTRAAAATGAIFSCAGLVDVVLFGLTRNIISVPYRRQRIQAGDESGLGAAAARGPRAPGTRTGQREEIRIEVQQDTVVFDEEGKPKTPKRLSNTPFWASVEDHEKQRHEAVGDESRDARDVQMVPLDLSRGFLVSTASGRTTLTADGEDEDGRPDDEPPSFTSSAPTDTTDG